MSAVGQSLIEIDEQVSLGSVIQRSRSLRSRLTKLVHGSSPEEIHFQYPHLSLAQVYAALAYYYDHQNELDSEIQRRLHEINEMAAHEATRPLQERLRKFRRGPIIESLLVSIHPQ